MKVLKVKAENFGSYREIEFDYDNKGLALISGPTGSGKSTLQDLVPWVLYGSTAKGGKADDICSWGGLGTTRAVVEVVCHGQHTIVTRSRMPNDLSWTEGEDGHVRIHRGKDLVDTQALLVSRLGVSEDAYIAGSYFNEFAPSGAFFSSTAKARRELFEHIAETGLADTLRSSVGEHLKSARRKHAEYGLQLRECAHRLALYTDNQARDREQASSWVQQQKRVVECCRERESTFEAEKQANIIQTERTWQQWEEDRQAQTQGLVDSIKHDEAEVAKLGPIEDAVGMVQDKIKGSKDVCPTCGGPDPKIETHYKELVKLNTQLSDRDRLLKNICVARDKLLRLSKGHNPFEVMLLKAKTATNPYKEQAEREHLKVNPYEAQLQRYTQELKKAEKTKLETQAGVVAIEEQISILEQLSDLSQALRGELIRQTVCLIEGRTNSALERYFDGEFRVVFSIEGSDKLEVEIYKDGNLCNYKQLSKGQRQLLKLTFSVAVMEASANRIGQHFDCLMFDEGLDGLDASLKVKAYSLFEELAKAHSSVFVIDHSEELKQMFATHYGVENDPVMGSIVNSSTL